MYPSNQTCPSDSVCCNSTNDCNRVRECNNPKEGSIVSCRARDYACVVKFFFQIKIDIFSHNTELKRNFLILNKKVKLI